MKTLFELEQESSEGFCNPARTTAQDLETTKRTIEKRAYEKIHTPIDDSIQEEEDETE